MNIMYRQLVLVFLTLVGLNVAQAQDVDFIFSDASGDQNDTILVDVTAQGFTNVNLFNLLISWDLADIDYVDVVDLNPALPPSFFSAARSTIMGEENRATLVFQGAVSDIFTLSPTDVICRVRFVVVSGDCKSTRVGDINAFPRNIVSVINNGVAQTVTPDIIASTIELNGPCTGGDDDLRFFVESTTTALGERVCVNIRGENLDNIIGIQGLEMNFDPTALTYVNSTTPLPAGNLFQNEINAANGTVIFNLDYASTTGPVGLSGDTTVIVVCFDVLADCEESTTIRLERAGNFLVTDEDDLVSPVLLDDGVLTVECCSATATITNESCDGAMDGAISLDPDGCMDVVSYAWSNSDQGASISGLAAGEYDVTITYNNGSSTRIITGLEVLLESPAIVANVASVTPVSAGGDGAIDINVSGGTPVLTYAWSSGQNTQDIRNLDEGSYSLTITDGAGCSRVLENIIVSTGLSVSGVVQNVTCFGDSDGGVVLDVTGGSPPYNYSWSCAGTVDPTTGSISGLGAGTCVVTVSDNGGNSVQSSFVIGAPTAPIQATAQVTDDVNNNGGGAIDLTVSGGWGGYTFEWSDGFNTVLPNTEDLQGIFGGDYTVIVTDQEGCSQTFGPFEVDGLNVVATRRQGVTCFGDTDGAIDILVINGSGSYNYRWSCAGTVDDDGNISGLVAGECTVTVTDLIENRTVVRTFTVPGATEALRVDVDVTCTETSTGAVEALVTGGVAPYRYEWNTTPVRTESVISNLPQGGYTVVVTDTLGCQVTTQAEVTSCAGDDCFVAMDVITPNGDGANDNFIISCAEGVDNRLTIYTRWGEEVISYEDYVNQWAGVDRGNTTVDEGTYFWVLEVNDGGIRGPVIFKGTVLVLYELR